MRRIRDAVRPCQKSNRSYLPSVPRRSPATITMFIEFTQFLCFESGEPSDSNSMLFHSILEFTDRRGRCNCRRYSKADTFSSVFELASEEYANGPCLLEISLALKQSENCMAIGPSESPKSCYFMDVYKRPEQKMQYRFYRRSPVGNPDCGSPLLFKFWLFTMGGSGCGLRPFFKFWPFASRVRFPGRV